jgi:hypothetical protein
MSADRFYEEISPTYLQSIQTDMTIVSSYGKRSLIEQVNFSKSNVKA